VRSGNGSTRQAERNARPPSDRSGRMRIMQRYAKRSGPDSRQPPRKPRAFTRSSPWLTDAGLHNIIMRIFARRRRGHLGRKQPLGKHFTSGITARATSFRSLTASKVTGFFPKVTVSLPKVTESLPEVIVFFPMEYW